VKAAKEIIEYGSCYSCSLWLRDVWLKGIPLKLQLFCWLVCQKGLPSKELLASRGMDLHGLDLECEWCSSIETENHILLHCYWSWLVWSFIFKWFGIESPLPRTFESLLRCNPYSVKRISFYWKVVIRFTAWHIWLARDEAVFNNRYCCPSKIGTQIQIQSFLWLQASNKSDKSTDDNIVKWIEDPTQVLC
jgi:hypothetical protein